jgi:hypothetical protein
MKVNKILELLNVGSRILFDTELSADRVIGRYNKNLYFDHYAHNAPYPLITSQPQKKRLTVRCPKGIFPATFCQLFRK